MKELFPVLDKERKTPYYQQLYTYIRDEITSGGIPAGERLPSLRSLSKSTGLSITTIDQAYSQLTVEDYVESRAQSGYYVNDLGSMSYGTVPSEPEMFKPELSLFDDSMAANAPELYWDYECFDFNKWKKCTSRIINDFPEFLFFESNPLGEITLRAEIAKYLYLSRGVRCTPEQIIIGAGTQQITGHIATLLRKMGIEHVAMENPGYNPVRNTFRDRGFAITDVQVEPDGLKLEKLPANIKSAAYVSPSNHVFTGAIMPVARRYQLLSWAKENDSYIIEDDYDSELRYFGRPIPALKSLEGSDRVIYLGSFSSTLFAAVRISYMVLPSQLAGMFESISSDYSQTCSKLEQLTLAMFMETGQYHTHIKKLRKLYAQKLSAVTGYLRREASDIVEMRNSQSGINLLIRIDTSRSPEEIKKDAATLGIQLVPLQTKNVYLLYYNQIPLAEIPKALQALVSSWRGCS
ncbi:MAG: PLP-dependent aminotransferase family protein [Firmicutes bacterium]|nr:PLP-dependent aminotransferase family protein [Bacillota bacterium]